MMLKEEMNQDIPESEFPDPEYDALRAAPITNIGKLAGALAKAQGELVNVEKKHEGYQGRYRFADLGQCLDVVRPVFSKHGLAVTQLVSDAPDGRVSVTTMILHESGQVLQTTASMAVHQQAGNSPAQAAGSVITYLRRYQITAMAGIAQEDHDAAQDAPQRGEQADKPAQRVTKKERQNINPAIVRDIGLCEDLQKLKEMWEKIPKEQHALYESTKNMRKDELSNKEADKAQEKL